LGATVAVAQAGRIVARGTLGELSLEHVNALLVANGPGEEGGHETAAA
jgi:hypothetical protein